MLPLPPSPPPPFNPPSVKITSRVSNLDALPNVSEEERTVASVLRTAGPRVAYVASVYNLPRRKRGRRRIRGIIISGSGRSKGDVPPPERQSLGSKSGFVMVNNGYLVTNFHVVKRAYDMKLVL